ncbi:MULTISPECIES: hypothetical protein [Arthrobacter]|uniref:Lipoprotein n=2 Tax=Arthrobacter TaxID=1663 RepID=A0ABU9KJH7_9MICC|nr:hypothetical protein [Arthrobacter sp. YJM1]MDP5226689.1 hypothetical protein [Arthrobacter sp. YJM1]
MRSTGLKTIKPGKRALAAAAMGVGLLAATTACSATSPQQTTHQYAASDGVNAQFADLKIRNAMVVSDGEKNPGRLLGTIFNGSASDVVVTVNGAEGSQTQVRVKANNEVSLDAGDPAVLSTTGAKPGALVDLKFSGEGQNLTVQVPVLDGTIKEYRPFLPTPSPTATHATATPMPTATESAK